MRFINPNWHVLLIHFPLGLLTTALVCEIVTMFWKNALLRSAGRIMFIIGAFSSIITMAAGIYAYSDIFTRFASTPAGGLELLDHHKDLNAIAVCIAAIAAFISVAAWPKWEKILYPLLFIALIAAVGISMTAAWFGGEAVYRYSAAILANPAHSESGIEYYVKPLELHITAAGTAIALAFFALALTIRKQINPPQISLAPVEKERALNTRVWWGICLLVLLLVAVAGFWAAGLPDRPLLIVHLVIGVLLIIDVVILAYLAGDSQKRPGLMLGLGALAIVYAGIQILLGVTMLFPQ